MTSGAPAAYVLPIRRGDVAVDPEFTTYLERVAQRCELIIVDGSEPGPFASAHEAWCRLGLHIAPDVGLAAANGKVRGVLTGIARTTKERIVIADDDVRYTRDVLERAIEALDGADLVRPQNYFDPVPWHARWDTARTLLNRATGDDFPGTLLVRRSILERTGGYDGDVLFENLELIRTVEAAHGRVVSAPDLYVRRLPPSARHFWSQRPRQAYDEFARPGRLLASLLPLPLTAVALSRRRYRALAVVGVTAMALAARGRQRAGGATVFPATASFFAPVWLLERSLCSWLALAIRAQGGVRYGDERLRTAATSKRTLRTRFENRSHG